MMIIPPPDLRTIIETTASFVARNGVDFERKIASDEQKGKRLKFGFLSASDPYYNYYKHKVSTAKSGESPPPFPPQATEVKPSSSLKTDVLQHAPAEPEPEQFLFHLPEGTSSSMKDLVKLCAQFAARNGSDFLCGIAAREHCNPAFGFLWPDHFLNKAYVSLLDAYSKVLNPPEGLAYELEKRLDRSSVLERCRRRIEWENLQKRASRKAEEEKEQERMAMESTDWHDFAVVEWIYFLDEEDEALPAPLTQKKAKEHFVSVTEDQEEEVAMVDMEVDVVEDASIIVMGKDKQAMTIVKNWKRPEERNTTTSKEEDVVISPITLEVIPVTEMEEHVRISLIDPRFKEQKERRMAKRKWDSGVADNCEVSHNLMDLARRRTDIFGTVEEEVFKAISHPNGNQL